MAGQARGVGARLATICLVGLALVCAAGCGKSKGSVSGKVTLKDGTPVGGVTLTFWSATENNRLSTAMTNADGTYSTPDAPTGEVKVTVTVPPPPTSDAKVKLPPGIAPSTDKAPPAPHKPVVVPDKYKKKDTTPLSLTVERGSQQKDFVIEPK